MLICLILVDQVFENTYTNDRHEGLLYGFDNSHTRIGRQITKNWCGAVLSQIKVPWTQNVLSHDRIRTLIIKLRSILIILCLLIFNIIILYQGLFYFVHHAVHLLL